MRLDVGQQILVEGDAWVPLTKNEFAIVSALAAGHVVPVDKLVYAMHGDEETNDSENAVTVTICRLRKKFRDAGLGNVIGNVWGRGYHLNAPMEMDHSAAPITIPAVHRQALERLLFSHPDHASANKLLPFVVA